MADYYYSNTSVATSLSGSISAGDTSITVDSATGFPGSFPYILALDYEGTTEELVSVTAAAGTSLTVTRGFGGTSAQSHSLGAAVRHVANAQDFTDFRTHEDGGTAVHGLTGDVVGTTDTQTLTNKTLTSPTVNGGALSGTLTGVPDFSGDPTFSGNPSFTGGPTFVATTDVATFEAPTAPELIIRGQVTGDAVPRLQVLADGKVVWGDGTTADTNLYRESADTLRTDDQLLFDRPTDGHDIIQARITGDAGLRFGIEANGDMFWGDGTDLTLDTGLSRTAVDTLTASAKFSATVETSGTFSAASGFTLNDANLRKTCGICTISVEVSVTSDIPVTDQESPNIIDTSMGTLPAGYIPTDNFETIWSSGLESGSALIGSAGVITLRTSDYSTGIQAGTNLRVSATYVL